MTSWKVCETWFHLISHTFCIYDQLGKKTNHCKKKIHHCNLKRKNWEDINQMDSLQFERGIAGRERELEFSLSLRRSIFFWSNVNAAGCQHSDSSTGKAWLLFFLVLLRSKCFPYFNSFVLAAAILLLELKKMQLVMVRHLLKLIMIKFSLDYPFKREA